MSPTSSFEICLQRLVDTTTGIVTTTGNTNGEYYDMTCVLQGATYTATTPGFINFVRAKRLPLDDENSGYYTHAPTQLYITMRITRALDSYGTFVIVLPEDAQMKIK